MNAKITFFILIAIILALVSVGSTSYYYLSQALSAPALDTIHKKIDLSQQRDNLNRIDQLKKELKDNVSNIDRASQIVASTKYYAYQNQIIDDINKYASLSGVDVVGYDFSAANSAISQTPKTSSGSGSSASPAAGSSTGNTQAADAESALLSAAGVRKLNVTVNLSSPTPLENYLKFLRAIELSLTKMQISGLTLTPDETDPNLITTGSVVLEIYTKK
jgi:hypothetical protein